MNGKRIFRNLALVILAALGVAMAFGGAGNKLNSLRASPELRAFVDKQVVRLDGPAFAQLLETNKGKPQLVFLYASWCPYCKRQFGQLHQLEGSTGKDGLTIHHISVENDVYALGDFLMQTYGLAETDHFTAYYAEGREDFYAVLRSKGATPGEGIPYLALFDAEGKLVRQFMGLTPLPALLAAVEEAK